MTASAVRLAGPALGFSAVLFVALLAVAMAPDARAAPTSGALYLSSKLEKTIPGEFAGCVNTPRYAITDTVADVKAGKAYFEEIPSAGGQVGCRIYFDYPVTSDFKLQGDATLSFSVACDNPSLGSPAGGEFRAMLLQGTTELSRVTLEAGNTCDTKPIALAAVLPTKDAQFAPGDTLTVVLVSWIANPPAAAAKNLHVIVAAAPPTLQNPGLATPAPAADAFATVYNPLVGERVVATGGFLNATTRTYVYNWTTAATAVDISLEATRTAGSVTASVVDASNKTVYSKVLAATGRDAKPGVPGAPGAWQLRLEYTGFVGNATLAIGPTSSVGPPSSGNSGTGTSGTSSSGGTHPGGATANATGSQTSSSTSKGAPSPLWVVGAGLAAVVLLRRRR